MHNRAELHENQWFLDSGWKSQPTLSKLPQNLHMLLETIFLILTPMAFSCFKCQHVKGAQNSAVIWYSFQTSFGYGPFFMPQVKTLPKLLTHNIDWSRVAWVLVGHRGLWTLQFKSLPLWSTLWKSLIYISHFILQMEKFRPRKVKWVTHKSTKSSRSDWRPGLLAHEWDSCHHIMLLLAILREKFFRCTVLSSGAGTGLAPRQVEDFGSLI